MIVIGADTHKGSHALAAVDDGTGKVRGHREIAAEDAGHLAAVRWARGLDDDRVWAIEDCRHVSQRFEQALIAAGERVVRVPPQRMGASRKGERERGKSDAIDALAVARAVVKDGVEAFPAAYLDRQAMEVRLISDHRNDLVADRTRVVNRLRWHLLVLCPELESSLKRGAFNHPRVLDRVDRRLRKLPAGARERVAREQVVQLRALNRQIDQLHHELAELVAAHRPNLLTEQGCGALTAAILIGHTSGNQQFRKEASFAMKTGTPPVPCSSGQRTQHRLNRGGDRQLNHALHIIAITRAQRDPATKDYLARKEAEGKTGKGALRSLKRHLARRFHRLLAEPPADQQQATNSEPTVEPQPAGSDDKPREIPPPPPRQREVQPIDAAPALMVCIT